MVERVLDDDLPIRTEPRHDGLHEPGMPGVGEPVEFRPLPSENQVNGDPQRSSDLLDQAEGRVLGLAALEERHGLLRDPGQRSELGLGQAATPPHDP